MQNIEQPRKNSNLIYDVGMHKGEDTDYFLKKGFKVIAFEADPDLIAGCKIKFADEIDNGKLIIIEGAIVEFSSEIKQSNTVKFFKNKNVSVWGTVVSDWAFRNEHLGTSNEIIEVPTINFSEYLKQYGIPYYLKIDIEGMDLICLKTLIDFHQKPDYISIESEKLSFTKLKEEFNLFTILGYSKFQAINQSNIFNQKEPKNSKEGHYMGHKFQAGSSGLFGTDLPNKWKNKKQILNEYKRIFLGYKLFGDYAKPYSYFIGKIMLKIINSLSGGSIPGWYDTHAKHDSVIDSNQ